MASAGIALGSDTAVVAAGAGALAIGTLEGVQRTSSAISPRALVQPIEGESSEAFEEVEPSPRRPLHLPPPLALEGEERSSEAPVSETARPSEQLVVSSEGPSLGSSKLFLVQMMDKRHCVACHTANSSHKPHIYWGDCKKVRGPPTVPGHQPLVQGEPASSSRMPQRARELQARNP